GCSIDAGTATVDPGYHHCACGTRRRFRARARIRQRCCPRVEDLARHSQINATNTTERRETVQRISEWSRDHERGLRPAGKTFEPHAPNGAGGGAPYGWTATPAWT